MELGLHPLILARPSEGQFCLCCHLRLWPYVFSPVSTLHCTTLSVFSQMSPVSASPRLTMFCPKGALAVSTDGMSSWCLISPLTKIWNCCEVSMGHWASDCQLFEAASRASSTKFLDYSALEMKAFLSPKRPNLHRTTHQIADGLTAEPHSVTLNTVCSTVKCSLHLS